MKVAELFEQFEDIPLKTQWTENPPSGSWKPSEHDQWVHERRGALQQRDLMLFWRMVNLLDNYPDDICIQSFASGEDDRPLGSYLEVPDPVKADPNAFVQIKSDGTWLDEDLATGARSDQGHEDTWDDVHEIYFVRKTKPSLIKAATNIIQSHQRIEVQRRNSWRWK